MSVEQTAEPIEHDWRYDGISPHNGEYWYKCAKCGASDWIASYGTLDQLMPRECTPPTPVTENVKETTVPKPSDYKAIRAWGKYLGSMGYYIEQVQEQAAAENAPLDAIYLRIGPAQWVTVRDLAPENRFRAQFYEDNPPPKR